MQKIKILQFPIANSFGGITHYALDNWKWLDKSRFVCDFATMSRSLDFADDILRTGSKIHYISCYAEENRAQFEQEFSKILDCGYDVVHLHTKQWKSLLVEELCRQRGVKKVIVHSHSTRCDNNDDEKRRQETEAHYKIRTLFNESLATDFWACSREAADWLFGDRIPASRIQIMNNAIETERFLFNEEIRARLRAEYALDGTFLVGHVARMVYQKNHRFLLRAFARAYKANQNLRLALVGDGEFRADLESLVRALGIQNAVLFLGKRDDVNDLYQMMDLFVLPSHFEGNPIVAIEAQAAGLRVLLADNISREADVTGNVTYLPLDESAWAEAIAAAPAYVRKNMARVIAAAGFDASTQIKVIEAAYIAQNTLGGGTSV